MTKLTELAKLGQAIWLDYIRRSFITTGELQALIERGLRGAVSYTHLTLPTSDLV